MRPGGRGIHLPGGLQTPATTTLRQVMTNKFQIKTKNDFVSRFFNSPDGLFGYAVTVVGYGTDR